MLLIFPPVAKPSEPPAGIAKLAGALKANGLPCQLLDANAEGLLYLAHRQQTPTDTWTRRAVKNITKNISALRDPNTYQSFGRYARAVNDLNRVIEFAGKDRGITASLADYQDRVLSPVRSADLLEVAVHPERNIFYPYFKERLPQAIDENMVGISLNYLSQALSAFAMIGFIKREFPGIKIVLGGGLVTSWMKRPGWKDHFCGLVDHYIAGPGEHPLLSLLGITECRQSHSTPDYGSLPLSDYLAPGSILPYSGSSGCYWNKCSFCPETAEDNPYVPVPAPKAHADLSALALQMKPVMIHLLDNAVSPSLLRELAERSPVAPWYGFARIGAELSNFEFCLALKESGCVMLKLGLESGDQVVLDKMRKGIDLGIASRALENLKQAGIMTYVYLLFGTPEETVAGARKTLEFVVKHRESISCLNLAIFNMPLSGDRVGVYETGEFYVGDLSLYTGFNHPGGWDRKQVRLFLDDEFKRDKAVASILKNNPPIFSSNHAAFFQRHAKASHQRRLGWSSISFKDNDA